MNVSRRSFFKTLAGLALGLACAPIKTATAWAAPAPTSLVVPKRVLRGRVTIQAPVQAKLGAFRVALEKELDGLIADFDTSLEWMEWEIIDAR